MSTMEKRKRKFADYEDGTAPHSDGVSIEESTLSDGSLVYAVLYTEPDTAQGSTKLRIACVSEEAAWHFADALVDVSWIEVLE